MSDEPRQASTRVGCVSDSWLLLASRGVCPCRVRVARSPGCSRGVDAGAMLGAIDVERVRPRGRPGLTAPRTHVLIHRGRGIRVNPELSIKTRNDLLTAHSRGDRAGVRRDHQVLTRSVGRARSTRRRMSSTAQPLAMHRTGLRSASTISGVSRSSSAKRSTSSRSAARSRRGRPRDPSSCVVTCSDASISSSASTSVFGEGGRRRCRGARRAGRRARPPSPARTPDR